MMAKNPPHRLVDSGAWQPWLNTLPAYAGMAELAPKAEKISRAPLMSLNVSGGDGAMMPRSPARCP
jgi:hypothetical protein